MNETLKNGLNLRRHAQQLDGKAIFYIGILPRATLRMPPQKSMSGTT